MIFEVKNDEDLEKYESSWIDLGSSETHLGTPIASFLRPESLLVVEKESASHPSLPARQSVPGAKHSPSPGGH